MSSRQPLFDIMESPWEVQVTDLLGEPASQAMPQPYSLDQELYTLHDLPNGCATRTFPAEIVLAVRSDDSTGFTKRSVTQFVTAYTFPDGRSIVLCQHDGPSGSSLIYQVGAGMTRRVHIGDFGGLLVHGQWIHDYKAGSMSWVPSRGAHLIWSVASRVLSLTGEGFSGDELLALAPSVSL